MHELICSLLGVAVFPFVAKAYENVALNKPAWQQHPKINYSADHAVDGHRSDLAVLEGKCAVSSYGHKTTEWRVDLGDVFYIHHIIIFFATDKDNSLTRFLLGFSVTVSNTTYKENGILCFRDTSYTRATIPNPAHITCPYYGRYVIYYNNRTHTPFPEGYANKTFNALCEVEVFGCPPNSNYGEGFCLPCPPNCQGGICDKNEGICQSCVAGYTGTKCNEECDAGSYGSDCATSCGECIGEQCHHVNGSCLNGCDPGYQGTKCTESCSSGYCNNTCSVHCSTSGGTCDVTTGACIWLGNGQNDTSSDITAALVSILVVTIFGIVFIRIWAHVKRAILIPNCNYSEETEFDSNVTGNPDELSLQLRENVNGLEEMELTSRTERNESITFTEEIIAGRRCGNVKDTQYTSTTGDSEIGETSDLNSKCKMHANYESISNISIQELQYVLREMKTNTDGIFKTEYESLPSGEQHFCDVAKQHKNIPKNRYKTVLPYDHSRVILKGDDESSDYINANYIYDNYQKPQYIATQGPQDNTINDFWRMIWQEKVTQVVMLTNLIEGGKIKCSQYWPICMASEFDGDITIKNVVETYCAFYITRKLVLSHKQESRVVMQYHFTIWPDHGTPEPLDLVVFHSHVIRTRFGADKAPVVVHCSAGVGRTGTYIALDALYKEGKMTGKVNVAEYVKVMRSNRVDMVQTYEQYMMIFIALNEEFKASVTTERVPNFVEKIDSLINTPENKIIQEEFEKLLQIRQKYTKDNYKEAEQYLLNTKDIVLPLDKYVLYLTSPVRNRGSFINGIHVSSYLQRNAFIVTHYPTPEDAVDFLRLLIDHESDTVICMDPLLKIESSTAWLPGSASVKAVSPFSVQHIGEIDTNVRVTNLRILGREGLSHPVVIVEPRGNLRHEGASQDTSSLLSLVSYALSTSTGGPITIVSRDGASLCGVFCAVFNSVQQMNMDNSVDVFTTVRQIQTRRPEFCSNMDEYWLVNRALRDYIGTTTENVYCNV